MTLSTVAVTGGNGKIGRAVLGDLAAHGYETVNLSRGPREEDVSDAYLTTELLDAGEVYGALATADADAVVHMGTIPDPYEHPEHVTYRSNVLTAAHVLEAAASLGLESVCLASSVNAMGAEHQRRPAAVEYLPVDEDHPLTPDDAYGVAKHAMEVTADGVGRRPDLDLTVSSLRLPWVPTGAELVEEFVDPDRTLPALREADPSVNRDVLFSYLHLADAAAAARKAVEADHEGHEAFWTVAADTSADAPSEELAAAFYPAAEVRDDLDGHEALIDCGKAEELLGWTAERTWRDC